MIRIDRLDPSRAFVLVIDLQVKLLPLIRHHESVIRACRELLEGAKVFDLPVIATEQYPKGIGATEATIQDHLKTLDSTPIEKSSFSVCGESTVREAMSTIDRPQVLVVGIEAHVCVLQSVLDLRTMDYDVFVCADAIGSRGKRNYKWAIDRMRQAGAFVTSVESALFELCHRCDTPRFKPLIDIIKAYPPKDAEKE